MRTLRLLKTLTHEQKTYSAGTVVYEPDETRARELIASRAAEEYVGPEKQKNYFFDLVEETGKKIVQERAARHTILLVALGSTLVENAAATSSNLCINDDSGVGKDHIARCTLELLRETGRVQKKSRISPTTYTYWHHNEENWTWAGQIQYLEDISSSILNSEIFKVFSSGGTSATIVVNQKAVEFEIPGNPSLIITTSTGNPNPEMLRRFPILSLDSGQDQTRAIMNQQARDAKSGKVIEYDSELLNSICNLKTVKVRVQFADQITPRLNDTHPIMRTHFPRFLDYVKFSAAIHQYTRKIDKGGFLLAEGADFDIARQALISITSNPLSVPLTKKERRVLESLQTDVNYSIRDIEVMGLALGSQSTVWRLLNRLEEKGFLRKEKLEAVEGKPETLVFCKVQFSSAEIIPSWDEIQKDPDRKLQDFEKREKGEKGEKGE